MGWRPRRAGSARSASAAPTRTSSSRRRRPAPARRRCARSAGAAVVGPNRRGTAGVAVGAGRRVVRPGRAGPVRRRLHARGPANRERAAGGRRQRPCSTPPRARRARARQRVRRRVPATGPQPDPDRVVFLFPGQGAQHAGMARGLYETEPVFAEHFDQCAAGSADELGIDLRAEVFDGPADDAGAHRPRPARPVRGGVRAGATLLESYGVHAGGAGRAQHRRIRRGHAGGRVRPADRDQGGVGARTSDARAATRRHGRGGVRAPTTSPSTCRRTSTSPRSTIPATAWSPDPSKAFARSRSASPSNGIPARRVRTSHAFHSSAMDAVLAEFGAFLRPHDAARAADPVAVQH